ncbi:hypothetical protein AL073_01270 [Loktanella sp. 1ANDIMAR09]|nr:hypothetical protein AL073_01270 [Loktanella sp. 1ANDIMAR09]
MTTARLFVANCLIWLLTLASPAAVLATTDLSQGIAEGVFADLSIEVADGSTSLLDLAAEHPAVAISLLAELGTGYAAFAQENVYSTTPMATMRGVARVPRWAGAGRSGCRWADPVRSA